MHHIIIKNFSDLHTIKIALLYLFKKNSLTEEDIHENFWAFTIDPEFLKALTRSDLIKFITDVIDNRIHRVNESKFTMPVTFYFWFDKQELQLKINVISGNHNIVPFEHEVNVVESPAEILERYFAAMSTQSNDQVHRKTDGSAETSLDVYRQAIQ